ncbi:hypothetical protein COLO4_38426 [Corchorus olitorius]|uniref:Uncharacterized protein n=1 Tax=Corchorus olitorius TaxID=93759 RepID=A0A1R3FV58_9ROSI|nr:hypothetical protein COLO4_38426 [Corchorus olitorius]
MGAFLSCVLDLRRRARVDPCEEYPVLYIEMRSRFDALATRASLW